MCEVEQSQILSSENHEQVLPRKGRQAQGSPCCRRPGGSGHTHNAPENPNLCVDHKRTTPRVPGRTQLRPEVPKQGHVPPCPGHARVHGLEGVTLQLPLKLACLEPLRAEQLTCRGTLVQSPLPGTLNPEGPINTRRHNLATITNTTHRAA